MTRLAPRSTLLAIAAASTLSLTLVANPAAAATKKELVAKLLSIQQAEIEQVTRGVVERPAAEMMQEAGLAMQRQVPADKREAIGKDIEAAVKKYVDEAYPLARDKALKIAPLTIGATLEEKFSEEELTQLVTFLDSPVAKKYQSLGPDMRNAFIRRLLTDAQPVVDPKVQALDARIRTILGVPPAVPGGASGANPRARMPAPAAAPAPAAKASR